MKERSDEMEVDVQRLVLRVLRATAFDNCDDVWWRTDGKYAPVTFMVNCNDLFAWGCADCETLTAENIELLEQSYKDAAAVSEHGEIYGALLFCCRSRQMRPQGACYSHFPKELWPLLDKCGEERETGFGNPYKPGEYKSQNASSEVPGGGTSPTYPKS